MANKTENRIKELIKVHGELDATAIREETGLTYDTVTGYLKNMVDEGILEREARGNPWMYYYRLRTNKQQKLN